jgi:hypothetical protein
MRTVHALVATAAALFAMSSQARAITLDPASASASVTIGLGSADSDTGTNFATASAAFNGASGNVTVNGQPFPSISGEASTTGQGLNVLGDFTYFFAVVGPSSISVPVIISASGEVSMPTEPPTGLVFSSLSMPGTILPNPHFACLSPSGGCPAGSSSSFSLTTTVPVLSNTQRAIALSFNIQLLDGAGSASGLIDPLLTIDPVFALANPDFHLEFSDGVGNSAANGAVPVPAALPLFASGLGLMGLLGWRRKRSGSAAIAAA